MKLVIVGGVAGGASAAARARRISETAEIIVFERDSFISFANCGLPYHIGGEIQDRSALLVQTPESMKARFKLDIRINCDVIGIDSAAQTVRVREASARGTMSLEKLVSSAEICVSQRQARTGLAKTAQRD